MAVKAAKIEKSERLQRVLLLLQQGGEFTTRDIQQLAHVSAVSASISELRQNGKDVKCRKQGQLYYYRLGGGQ